MLCVVVCTRTCATGRTTWHCLQPSWSHDDHQTMLPARPETSLFSAVSMSTHYRRMQLQQRLTWVVPSSAGSLRVVTNIVSMNSAAEHAKPLYLLSQISFIYDRVTDKIVCVPVNWFCVIPRWLVLCNCVTSIDCTLVRTSYSDIQID